MSKNRTAIEAAIALPWSNGQTEGQICKPKLVERQIEEWAPRGGQIEFKELDRRSRAC